MIRVLIVDDQPTFRREMRNLLTVAGFEVVGEAKDIQEAKAQMLASRPNLAVVDVMLPGTNGIEGTALLKALDPALRVILVSAYRDRSDLFTAAAAAAGAEAFLPKEELDLETVREWGRHRAHADPEE